MTADSGDSWKLTFYLMLAVQFIMSMSLTVIVPILPLYLSTIGGIHQDQILIWTGVITSVNLFVAAAASPLWGVVGDRRGRKLMVLRSSAAICLFTLAMIFSVNVWVLLATRARMGAFSGFGSAANTLVASRVPIDRLGFALGWLSTSQMIGTFLGPLAGGVLLDLFADYRIVFLWTSTLALIAFILVWCLVPQDHVLSPAREKSAIPRTPWQTVVRAVLPFFVLLVIAQIALRSVQPVITVFVASLSQHAKNIATLAGLAFSIVGLADLVGSPFLGKRSDLIGYKRVLLIALTGSVVFTIPQAFVSGYKSFLLERFCAGLFISSVIPTAQALLATRIAPRDRGLAYGIGASATFLGGGLGPLVGAFAAATLGPRSVFLLTALILMAAILWVWWRLPTGSPATPRTQSP
jgi:DHA1 family multidrug resistance protein-like MFS transporter